MGFWLLVELQTGSCGQCQGEGRTEGLRSMHRIPADLAWCWHQQPHRLVSASPSTHLFLFQGRCYIRKLGLALLWSLTTPNSQWLIQQTLFHAFALGLRYVDRGTRSPSPWDQVDGVIDGECGQAGGRGRRVHDQPRSGFGIFCLEVMGAILTHFTGQGKPHGHI